MKRVFIAFIVLFASPLWATVSVVQSGHSTGGSSGTATAAVTLSAITSGNTVIWAVECHGATGVFSSMADDKSNTYPAADTSLPASGSGGGSYVGIGHLSNVTNGPTTFTATCATVEFDRMSVTVYEVSGLASSPLDVHTGSNYNNVPSPAAQSFTSAVSGELGVALGTASSVVFSGITSWTTDSTGSGYDIYAHVLSLPSGSNSASATWASGNNGVTMVVATYEPTGGASCTNAGETSTGTSAVPNGSSGSYVGNAGAFVTPNCSSTQYFQPRGGKFGTTFFLPPLAALGWVLERRRKLRRRTKE